MKKGFIENLIRKEIIKADPIGLINMGAPDDEYDPEVREIMTKSHLCGSKTDWESLIYETFVRMFDKRLVGQRETYRSLAKRIYGKINIG